jgi:hypothetical protein
MIHASTRPNGAPALGNNPTFARITFAHFGEISGSARALVEPTKNNSQEGEPGEENCCRASTVIAVVIRCMSEANRLHGFFTQQHHGLTCA